MFCHMYFEFELLPKGVCIPSSLEIWAKHDLPTCIYNSGIVENQGPPHSAVYGWYLDCRRQSCPYNELQLKGTIDTFIDQNHVGSEPLVNLAKILKTKEEASVKNHENKHAPHNTKSSQTQPTSKTFVASRSDVMTRMMVARRHKENIEQSKPQVQKVCS